MNLDDMQVIVDHGEVFLVRKDQLDKGPCVPLVLGNIEKKGGKYRAMSIFGATFYDLPSEEAAVEALRSAYKQQKAAWEQETFFPLPVGRGAYLTKDELVEANNEAIRLGFNRTLDAAEHLPDLRYPIARAFHHGGYIRLALLIASSGDEKDLVETYLDVSPDLGIEGLEKQAS